MIFENIKSIVIPEGNVTSIKNAEGLILWENNTSNLFCEPSISLKLNRYIADNGIKRIKQTLSISGISHEYVQKAGVVHIKYKSGLKLTLNTAGRTEAIFKTNDPSKWPTNPEDVWSSWVTMIPASPTLKVMFRGYIKYTDLNGATKTLYTDIITASYNSLTAE